MGMAPKTVMQIRADVIREINRRHGGNPILQAQLNVPDLAHEPGVLGVVCMHRDRFTTKRHYLVLDGELEADRELVELFARHVQGLESTYGDLRFGTAADWIVVVTALS